MWSKHWLNGDPLATHLSNALHIMFPAGEQFLIRSVRVFSDRLEPELKERVQGFIGQEAQHSREHRRFWDVIRAQGVPVDAFERFYSTTAYGWLEPLARRIGGDVLALSATAAIEHYTAIMAEQGLRGALEERASEVNLPREMQRLFQWHAAEEIEHKSVAFDVLRAVNDSYGLRVLGMVMVTVLLWGYAFAGQAFFVLTDRDFRRMPLSEKWRHLRGSPREGSGSIVGSLLTYFRRDFHPDDVDNMHLARAFFARQSALLSLDGQG